MNALEFNLLNKLHLSCASFNPPFQLWIQAPTHDRHRKFQVSSAILGPRLTSDRLVSGTSLACSLVSNFLRLLMLVSRDCGVHASLIRG